VTFRGDEQSKAATEVAKLGQQISESLKKLFDPALGELGEWMGSYVRGRRQLWEHQNVLALVDRIAAIHAARRIKGKPVPIHLREGVPLLEAIAAEDEPTLQGLWAGLIANATDPSDPKRIKKAFIDVLRSLDPIEALILEAFRPMLERADPTGKGERVELAKFAGSVPADEQEVLLGLHHLGALGCVRVSASYTVMVTDDSAEDAWPAVVAPEAEFSVTSLARSLLQACDPR
jgi:hypothetical protein